LLERVPATLQLVGTSTIAAVVIALIVGVVTSIRRGIDRWTMPLTIAGCRCLCSGWTRVAAGLRERARMAAVFWTRGVRWSGFGDASRI
jgi:hypothetical protein